MTASVKEVFRNDPNLFKTATGAWYERSKRSRWILCRTHQLTGENSVVILQKLFPNRDIANSTVAFRRLIAPIRLLAVMTAVSISGFAASPRNPRQPILCFEISFARDINPRPVDGRVLLLISTDGTKEPRLQFFGERILEDQQMFGVEANALQPEQTVVVDGSVLGFPMTSLSEIRPGDYFVQALLNRYTTFHRSDGYTLKLPRDEGEGQKWALKPGNLYSDPVPVHIDPRAGGTIRLRMTRVIPRIEPPADTKYVKHVRVKSELLSKVWGEPVYLGAIVLLPEGWDSHPDAHYPLVIEHNHFARDLDDFSENPPALTLTGKQWLTAEYAYKFYQDWTSGRLSRLLLVKFQHATPYHDDSYAINSANLGPYGDAINQELIPYLEKTFRGIGQSWARIMYGGSTGGTEALWAQLFYPDFYNGAWACCPDPPDFHAYQTVDIYNDQNAFRKEGPWGSVSRPDTRQSDGRIDFTMEQLARLEIVTGKHSSGKDLYNLEAVFGPIGPDGYPKHLWDPVTGLIDHDVAKYWRDHYDYHYILERDWKTLGPKLMGKIHIVVGSRDTFFYDTAVRLLQTFLESTNAPYYAGYIKIGPHQPHGYSADPNLPVDLADLVERQRVLPEAVEWMLKSAPAGADDPVGDIERTHPTRVPISFFAGVPVLGTHAQGLCTLSFGNDRILGSNLHYEPILHLYLVYQELEANNYLDRVQNLYRRKTGSTEA